MVSAQHFINEAPGSVREISFLEDRSAVKILSEYVSMRAISINQSPQEQCEIASD